MMVTIAYIAIALVAAFAAKLGIILIKSDPVEAKKNASRTASAWDAIMGRAHINNDWLPDARVQGGMVFNEKEQRIEVCGKVSDDSLDRAFRR